MTDPATETIVYMARLLSGKEQLYRELHDRIPAQIELHLREDGVVTLDIYRLGQELCMIVRRSDGMRASERNYDEELERWWQGETGQCFASVWQRADLVYTLAEKASD